VLELLVYPAVFAIWKGRALPRASSAPPRATSKSRPRSDDRQHAPPMPIQR
jgi:hypothetical protein